MEAESLSQESGALQRLSERSPEFWMLALSGAAWLFLFILPAAQLHSAGFAENWRHWMLMVLAMMFPLQIQAVRLTAERSLWSRRHRAIFAFLFGYLSLWAVPGALLSWVFVTFAIPHRVAWTVGSAIGFAIEALWLVSPAKQIASILCHRVLPLSPEGWRADSDCICYGWVIGYSCALNCWPLMLVCWLSGHSLFAMLLAFGLGWADRHSGPDSRLRAVAAAAIAAAFAVSSFIS